MNNNSYITYLLDTLSELGGIKSRKMFGGYGIYRHGIFFALIANNILYFKVNDDNRPDYQALDSQPFSYEGKDNKIVVMSYWQVPESVLEDHNLLTDWAEKALQAAKSAKK